VNSEELGSVSGKESNARGEISKTCGLSPEADDENERAEGICIEVMEPERIGGIPPPVADVIDCSGICCERLMFSRDEG
jgi:hypothetical protein